MALQQFKGIANQLKDELADSRDKMDAVSNAAVTQRNDLLKNAGICLDRAARTLNDLRSAQQALSPADQAQGRKTVEVMSNDLKRARQELATISSRCKAADLMGSAGPGGEADLDKIQMDQRAKALKNMANVDNQNKMIADGTKMIDETHQMTTASIEGLKKQKETLGRIGDNVNHIGGSLEVGSAALAKIKRRQKLSVIIFIVIIVVLAAIDIFIPVFMQVG